MKLKIMRKMTKSLSVSLLGLCRPWRRRIMIISACIIISGVLFLTWNAIDKQIVYYSIDATGFNPTLIPLEDLPATGHYKIQKIIHQTWKSKYVPNKLLPWLKTWRVKHPDWEYWFWTDESARKFISEHYPSYLNMYDSYEENIRRADAMRYFILYHYGGVYGDTDIEVLKPLDPILIKYSCFIAQEPPEHSILDGNFKNLAMNALMGCQKHHPFMKHVFENLPNFNQMWNVLDSTGPHFLTFCYKVYSKKNIASTAEHGVYLAPSEYFIPTWDYMKPFYLRAKCKRFKELSRLQQEACVSMYHAQQRHKPMPYSFTNHHWSHTYLPMGQLLWYSRTTAVDDLSCIPDAHFPFT